MSSQSPRDKLIECQTCFRTFHTQGQFGQHARICRGSDRSGSNSNRSISRKVEHTNYKYKYSFLEKQSKNELQIKTRFVINIETDSDDISWRNTSKKYKLDDNSIRELLACSGLNSVYFTVRNRKESGLIVANFIVRSVFSAKTNIHSAKLLIQEAVALVQNRLPKHITLKIHLCKIADCKELVIRDTEGYCSRHRAQKYHKKQKYDSPKYESQSPKAQIIRDKKRPLSAIQHTTQTQTKRIKSICYDLSFEILHKFFATNCYVFQTPFNLLNISVNQSSLRQNGINLISVNYSRYIPDTRQILKKNDYLICFGVSKDINSYLNAHDANDMIINNENSIRFQQFCEELIKYYIVYRPVPNHLIGTTLADIRLYEYGINVISINLNVEHAAKLSTTIFKPNDMLLCCFNRASKKHEQLFNAFNGCKT